MINQLTDNEFKQSDQATHNQNISRRLEQEHNNNEWYLSRTKRIAQAIQDPYTNLKLLKGDLHPSFVTWEVY